MKNQNIELFKQNLDILKIVRDEGFAPKKNGNGFKMLCPFHDDKNPSLSIDEKKQLFHCFGCGKSGDTIKFIEYLHKFTFKQAVEYLAGKYSAVGAHISFKNKPVNSEQSKADSSVSENISGNIEKNADSSGLINAAVSSANEKSSGTEIISVENIPVKSTADNLLPVPKSERQMPENLNVLAEEYHQALLQKKQALVYLSGRGIIDTKIITQFKIGYANGYVTFPFYDEQGIAGEIYSRAVYENAVMKHKYLPGPHKGIFNLETLKNMAAEQNILLEIYLCECVIDALSLYQMGIHNVTCSFGKGNLTDELKNALAKYCKRVIIAYDNDGHTDEAAERTSLMLGKLGLACERVILPVKDCNDFLVSNLKKDKELAEIKFLFGKSERLLFSAPEINAESITENRNNLETNSSANSSTNAEEKIPLALVKDEYGIMVFSAGERQYIVKGVNLKKLCDLRVYLKFQLEDFTLREQINLISMREKERFARRMKEYTGKDISEYTLLAELEDLSAYLEDYQEKKYIEGQEAANKYLRRKHVMTPAEEEAAKQTLRERDYLTDILLIALEAMGIKGERNNKILIAIAAISRLDKYPVHILVVAGPGTGKSKLQQVILSLLPEEAVFRLSRSTENVLYYMEPNALKNKIISIDETEGAASGNFYSYRTLMSEGRLEILYTGKDETGKFRAQNNVVEGPAVIFFATTNAEKIDEETRSRQLNLYGDESEEQTGRVVDSIFEADNTESGDEIAASSPHIVKLHQNMHSVILPIKVYIPKELKEHVMQFGNHLQARRNARMYGSALRSIVRSRQYQKEIFTNERGEQYIKADTSDVKLANELLEPVFADQSADLSGPIKSFYEKIRQYVDEHRGKEKRTEFKFSAKEIRIYLKMKSSRCYEMLTILVRMEYLARIKNFHKNEGDKYRLIEE